MTATSSVQRATGGDHRDVLRARLEQEREELVAQIAVVDEAPALTATTGSGETEHIVSGIELGVQVALDARLEARLVEISDALRRLEAGTYGRCERCGNEVSAARLEAIPHARFCVTCQRVADDERRSRPL
jgi:RNA polymerase-binding transcription factor DksA